ncbi:ATP-binding protein, partial [Pseudomonas aeruginosa]|uniref:ATP-binding protein n=1 Tax=Pseudomonas aeruginosa TaxID=287 RepID=UPI002F9167EC
MGPISGHDTGASLTGKRFIGRRDELERVHGLLAAARDSRPGLVLITGEAGIGKSRLITEALLTAKVLCGYSTPVIGPAIAYGPWLPILRELSDSDPLQLAVATDLDPTAGPRLETTRATRLDDCYQ